MSDKINKSIETRRMNKKQLQEKFIESYEKLANNVSISCKQVGIGRSTFYQWMDKDKDFADQIRDLDEAMLDFVESSLTKQIREGNMDVAINMPVNDMAALSLEYAIKLINGENVKPGEVTQEGAGWSPSQIIEGSTGLQLFINSWPVDKNNVDDTNLWGNLFKYEE